MTARVPPELRASDDWIGQVIGNYRLVRLLGEGGMGMVFEAYNEAAGGRAAVKILRPEVSMRAEVAGRFFNEARAANAIQHPGIVRVFDCGHTVERAAFLTMEFLEGKSLRVLLDGIGQLASADVVRLGRQMASALSAAHRKNVIHRDLKPDNLMLVADPDIPGGERVKILDFGIAKLAEGLSGAASVTDSNLVMGTPAYMAPEQCKGAKLVTDRSDVYSLGVIFYQMLAGRPPFIADAAGALLIMQVTETVPPLAQFAPDAHPALSNLIAAMLAKEPTARPGMETVQAELQRIELLLINGRDAATGSGQSHIPTVPLSKPPRELLLEMARAVVEEAKRSGEEIPVPATRGSTVTGAASESKHRPSPKTLRNTWLTVGAAATLVAVVVAAYWRTKPIAASSPPAQGQATGDPARPATANPVPVTAPGQAGTSNTAPVNSGDPVQAEPSTGQRGKPKTPAYSADLLTAKKHFEAKRYEEAIRVAEKCSRLQIQCSVIRAKSSCHLSDRSLVSQVVKYINDLNPNNKEKLIREITSECESDSLKYAETLVTEKQYQRAMSIAGSNKVIYPHWSWSIIGKSACGLRDMGSFQRALDHLRDNPSQFDQLKNFCNKVMSGISQ